MSSTDLHYLGDATWQPLGNPEPFDPPFDGTSFPTTTEVWIGRSDLTATTRGTILAIGVSYLGGYIIENKPRSNQPSYGLDQIDVVVARAPLFGAVAIEPDTQIKTSTKSATIENNTIIQGVTSLSCTRNVSYTASAVRYKYFASGMAQGSRYTTAGDAPNPEILRSVITVSGVDSNGNTKSITYAGSNAPAPVVSALFMPPIDSVTAFNAVPIPGTPGPWYRCEATVTRELAGDNS